jgi:salicylate hydroxylase
MPGKDIDYMRSYSTLEEDVGILGKNDVPADMRDVFGYSMRGVRRTELIRLLIDTAEAQGIPIRWDHLLSDIEQHDTGVTAVFANGFTDTGAFLVGCDGLHSKTRTVLFGEDPTTFLGLTQVRGIVILIYLSGVTDLVPTHIFRRVASVPPQAACCTILV